MGEGFCGFFRNRALNRQLINNSCIIII